jgi:hypothetical protein
MHIHMQKQNKTDKILYCEIIHKVKLFYQIE